jgi:hypothetical protein
MGPNGPDSCSPGAGSRSAGPAAAAEGPRWCVTASHKMIPTATAIVIALARSAAAIPRSCRAEIRRISATRSSWSRSCRPRRNPASPNARTSFAGSRWVSSGATVINPAAAPIAPAIERASPCSPNTICGARITPIWARAARSWNSGWPKAASPSTAVMMPSATAVDNPGLATPALVCSVASTAASTRRSTTTSAATPTPETSSSMGVELVDRRPGPLAACRP